ncbi:MAG: GNAT family N-acetyltransferase [Dokdonella sp.]|jgi:GNAT superfamily N-acetyltransferase|uniref:GNAT family N-acetyltransferase n=1 Tax=Dokdonella sp. TaxID=2291710 RepID=UPI001B65F1BD|nr:GNAT family N-acetyltransferase [Dokdonella sp.]MCC6440309.1 GNAT family N-acetyltransferase [Rhodanobacteraceae bacterium]MBK8122422.1 GNAT family N-acetyltransferase [Dokdonella sp.]MBP6326472.1 GNAT family N-acetyltransferase [Dokdonella sp.]MBP6328580.1 GNAT family N-acetyltransferase [Dokdonella sp.]HNV06907.1 GNAT family N-acetyltransferase [Dokdonella sp.]
MSGSVHTAVQLIEQFPDLEHYRRIRAEAGLAQKTLEASRRGLANTLYGVSLLHEREIIGMGRVIGDNGTVFVIADIAVVPAWQGRGLGRQIMKSLDLWLRRNAPESAYITLVANGDAKFLYAKFGFEEPPPDVVYMEYIQSPRGGDP